MIGAASSPPNPSSYLQSLADAQMDKQGAPPAKDPPRIGFLQRRAQVEGSIRSSNGSESISGAPRLSFSPLIRSSTDSKNSSPGSSEGSPKSWGSTSELNESPVESYPAHDANLTEGQLVSLDEGGKPIRKQEKASWVKANGSPSARRTESFTPTYRSKKEEVYRLSEPSKEELAEINQLIAKTPNFTRDYSVSIQKVENDILTEQFQAKMKGLSLKVNNAALTGTWDMEQEQETRQKVHSAIEKNKSPTQYNKVFTLSVFHATREKFLKDILMAGLEFLGKTDKGYFGQGIYSSTYLNYVADVYGHGDGVILICQICFRILFPVASCDELMGKPIKPLFDGHAVNVIPATERPNEMMYISMNPFTKVHKYDEYVVRDSSQVLIRYVLRVTPTGLNLKKVDLAVTKKDFKELIIKYLIQYPNDDQFIPLSQKLDELGTKMSLPLNSTDYQLFLLLQRSLGEAKQEFKAALGEKMKALLFKEEFPEGESPASLKLPCDFLKAQEMTQQECEEHFARGENYFQNSKFDSAIKEFQRVLSRLPEFIPALLGCGNAYLKKENYIEAINHFYAARKAEPKNEAARAGYVHSLIRNAVSLAQKKQYPDALRDLAHALRLDSNNVSALGICATIYFNQKEFNQAFAYCGRALSIDKKSPVALRVRGSIYANNGRINEALEDLSASIKLQPHTLSYLKRADLFISLGRYQEAENDCNELLKTEKEKTDSEHVDALAIRAKARLKSNKIDLAEADLKACFKKEETNLTVLSLLGELYFLKKDGKSALKYFNLYIECYQKFSEKGQIFEKDKVTYYQVLLTLANTHNILMKAQDIAISILNRAIEFNSTNPEGYQLRGMLYQARGEKEKGQLDLNKAIELANNTVPKQ